MFDLFVRFSQRSSAGALLELAHEVVAAVDIFFVGGFVRPFPRAVDDRGGNPPVERRGTERRAARGTRRRRRAGDDVEGEGVNGTSGRDGTVTRARRVAAARGRRRRADDRRPARGEGGRASILAGTRRRRRRGGHGLTVHCRCRGSGSALEVGVGTRPNYWYSRFVASASRAA